MRSAEEILPNTGADAHAQAVLYFGRHMGGSQQHFNKRQKELQRQKHRADKAERKKQRAANATGGGLENMMAYVDENGRLTSVPQPLVHPSVEEKGKE